MPTSIIVKFNVSKKVFAHIDCDSFFAECEIYRNPKLKNKYVLVGEEIVTACNYKTKALGIKTGTPVWKAEAILNGKGIFLKGDHRFYTIISDRLMKYLKENTLSIEPFSIDEAFCDITGLAELNKMSLERYAKKIQDDVLKEVGVPVSIGISNTRIKAKIFSKLNKPYGNFISMSQQKDREIFSKLPLLIIPYIGRKSHEKFKYSCKTVYDFIKLGYWNLKSKIGKNATDLRLELTGVNAFVVKKSHTIKSMSRGRSFNKNITNNKTYLKKQLIINFNWLYEEFINKDLEMKTVSIFFRDKEFHSYMFHINFSDYTYVRINIKNAIDKLFDDNYTPDLLYRSTGVVFSNFRSYKPNQTSIFDKPLRDKTNDLKLVKTINFINKKYGSHKVGYGDDLLGEKSLVKLGIRK